MDPTEKLGPAGRLSGLEGVGQVDIREVGIPPVRLGVGSGQWVRPKVEVCLEGS